MILTIYALSKCFSRPGNLGYDLISEFRFPEKIYLIYLETFIYSGVTKGNSTHSSKTLSVTQNVNEFTPVPLISALSGG